MNKEKILVTAYGGRAAQNLVRCLKESPLCERLYFIGADANSNCPKVLIPGYEIDDFVVIPSPRDENYVNEIKRIVKEKKISLVVPTSDEECVTFSKNLQNLDGVNLIPIGSYESVLFAKDKLELYNKTKDLDIVPRTLEMRRGVGIKEIQEEIGLPAFIKPRMGRGGRYTHIVEDNSPDEEKKLEYYWKSFNDDFGSPICQPFMNSADHGIDMYINKNGEVYFGAMRRKLSVMTGERVVGMQSISIFEQEMMDVSRKIVETLGLKGLTEIEMRRDSSNKFYAIDVNPRVGGSIYLSKASGSNIAMLPVLDFLNEPYPVFSYKTGVDMKREEKEMDGNKIFWDSILVEVK
jgi:carbamoyl-phosphate synthase large subunit